MKKNVFVDPAVALRYLFAGRAEITVTSNRTGSSYQWRIVIPSKYWNDPVPQCFFVWSGDIYLGVIAGGRFFPKKTSQETKAFSWVLTSLLNGRMAGYTLRHSGNCGRCGYPLIALESHYTGLGADCNNKMRG